MAVGALLAACGGAAEESPTPSPDAPMPDVAPSDEDEDGCPKRAFPLAEPATTARRPLDLTPFAAARAGLTDSRRAALDALLLEAPLADIQAALADSRTTSAELVTYYLDRIARYDAGGLNAVMALNAHAPADAAALDAERATAGPRGPLHGIPVLIKDNIATGDGQTTTAGAAALREWRPRRDAFLVARLRQAGAIILGKTNLSEWANYTDPCLPNGYSAVGGQTHSAYGPFDPSGSSTGSAVAVTANLAPLSVGSETQGSIIWPARDHSLVGLKPSLGLVSRSGVVPLVDWMDTPGPFGRTVADVAALLTALAAPGPDGIDADDPATAAAAPLVGRDFTRYLSPEMAGRVRVGVIAVTEEDVTAALAQRQRAMGRALTEEEEAAVRAALVEAAEGKGIAAALRAQGVPVVVIVYEPSLRLAAPPLDGVLAYGFGDSLDRFLGGWAADAPVRSLAEVAAVYAADPANRAPYGFRSVAGAVETPITAADYVAQVEANRAGAQSAIRAVLREHGVDVLAGEVGQAYAAAGFPALAVPNGLSASGEPVGVVFIGDYLSEPQLLAVGAAYERARAGRVAPELDAILPTLP
jgi:amidase